MQNDKKSNMFMKNEKLQNEEMTLQIIEKTLDNFLKINGDIKEIFASVCECAVNFKRIIKDSGYLEFLKQKYSKKDYESKLDNNGKVVN